MSLIHYMQPLLRVANFLKNAYVHVGVIALVYFAAARLSLSLLIVPEGIGAIWPPAGIFLSAILLSKRNRRPIIVGVLFLTDLIAEVLSGTPFLVSVFYSLALAGDAVISAWLLLRFVGDPFHLHSYRDVLGFLILSVGLSNAFMSMVAAAASTIIPDTHFWVAWVRWAVSAGIGNLLITPLLISWSEWRKTSFSSWNPKRVAEEMVLLILIVLLNSFAFHFLSENNQFGLVLTYLNIPLLLWAALRLDLRGVTLALFCLAGITIFSASTIDIPGMPTSEVPFDDVIYLQLYLVVIIVPSLLLVTGVDEQKRAEKNLRESEERFRHLAENIRDVFWINDARTGRVEYVSPAYGRIWGRARDALYDNFSNWLELIHPDDKNRVEQALADRTRNGSYDVEYRIVKPGNQIQWIHDRGFLVFDDAGQPKRWVGIAEDITGRKLAEEALRERNYFIESILENAPIGFAINRISTGVGTFVSRKFDAIYGVQRGSMNTVDEYFERVYLDPVFREQIRHRILTDMASGDPARMAWEDIPITTSAGEKKVVTAINIPLLEQDLMISTVQDVTKRWRAEEETRQRNEELDKIRTILSNLSSQFNLDPILSRALQGATQLTGTAGGIIFLIDPRQQELLVFAEQNVPPRLRDAFDGHRGNVKNTLWETVTKTGQPFFAWNSAPDPQDTSLTALCCTGVQFFAAFPLQIKNQYIGILSIFECSERKPTDQTLGLLNDLCSPIALAIENAQLYEGTRHEAFRAESLARTAARLIAQIDFDSVIHIVCEEAARALDAPVSALFLYDPQYDHYQLGADYGFPEEFRRSHLVIPAAVYEKMTANYGTEGFILDLPELHLAMEFSPFPDLQTRSVIAANILNGSDKIGVICVLAREEPRHYASEDLALVQGIADQAAQAITRARLFEQVSAGRKHLQALSQRLVEVQESERRTLALELHDELGQLLNSAKMSLDMIAHLPAQAAEEHLRRAQALVGDLVTRVREMSLQLRPSMLDDMGLLPALEWLLKDFQLQTGEKVTFKQTDIDQRFSPQVEITAYRIIQEALTNIIRHAGDEKKVRVEVWVDEQALNIQVRDWGKGFSPTVALQKHESSGLSGMRERARLLGGELVVESAPGSGTNLSARLPLSNSG